MCRCHKPSAPLNGQMFETHQAQINFEIFWISLCAGLSSLFASPLWSRVIVSSCAPQLSQVRILAVANEFFSYISSGIFVNNCKLFEKPLFSLQFDAHELQIMVSNLSDGYFDFFSINTYFPLISHQFINLTPIFTKIFFKFHFDRTLPSPFCHFSLKKTLAIFYSSLSILSFFSKKLQQSFFI